MSYHILVPLDGSPLAECVLPHALALAKPLDGQITLLHVLETSQVSGYSHTIDPLDWQITKTEAVAYLNGVKARLKDVEWPVQNIILEGKAADRIIEFAQSHNVDLIALSSHGRSGLSGWNISSVVQKIILRAHKSTLLVRAYHPARLRLAGLRYQRLLIPLDCSVRAECVLPLATNLARFYDAQLLLAHVVRKPEIPSRVPLTNEELRLANLVVVRNQQEMNRYFEQLYSQISMQGIDLQTRLEVSEDVAATLHRFVQKEQVDLVLLAAHGYTGSLKWPYGSVTTSFIAYGTTSLLIVQDLSAKEVERTQAEIFTREFQGH